MGDTFRIALVQMKCDPQPGPNLDKAEAAIRTAAKQGAQIVCLPELFLGPFFCQKEDTATFDLAEPIPGPSSDRLSAAAKAISVVDGRGVVVNTRHSLLKDGPDHHNAVGFCRC